MKYGWIIFIFVFIFGISFTVSATNTDLVTQPLLDEEKSDIAQREFVKITSYTPLVAKCFDVRDDHMVVVGAKKGNTAFIAVYNDGGVFQYGFKTTEYGSFRVMWSGNDIAYYSIRSTFLFVINENGTITEAYRVANTMENSIYDRDVLMADTKQVGDSTYHMTNESAIADAFLSSYKKIIKTSAGGTTVIYDAGRDQNLRIVGGIAIFLLVSAFIADCCVVSIKRQGKKKT